MMPAVFLLSGHRDDQRAVGVVSRYDLMDFPFMVAALQLTATSLESLLDEHGKGIADGIVANTTCITIDASELKRQAKEE